MQPKLQLGALALLIFAACRHLDTAQFDDVTPAAGGNGTGASGGSAANGGSGTNAGSGAKAGAETGGGETGGSQSVAGTAPGAGGDPDMPTAGTVGRPAGGSAGTSGVPQPTDAGAPTGTGGTGKMPEPTCGNGVIDPDEECDDEGHTGADGCDTDCKVNCEDFGPDATESDDHHCYNGYDEGTFQVAREACVKRGGHLATITSANENQIVRKYVNDSKWIGAFEDVSASSRGRQEYAWVTGEPFAYTDWAKREPNGGPVWCSTGILLSCYEHCVAMGRDGAWADAGCDVADGYVCEWDPPGRK